VAVHDIQVVGIVPELAQADLLFTTAVVPLPEIGRRGHAATQPLREAFRQHRQYLAVVADDHPDVAPVPAVHFVGDFVEVIIQPRHIARVDQTRMVQRMPRDRLLS